MDGILSASSVASNLQSLHGSVLMFSRPLPGLLDYDPVSGDVWLNEEAAPESESG